MVVAFLGSFSYVKEERRMPAACSSETVAVVIVGSKNGRVFLYFTYLSQPLFDRSVLLDFI